MPLEGSPAWLAQQVSRNRVPISGQVGEDVAQAVHQASGFDTTPEDRNRIGGAFSQVVEAAYSKDLSHTSKQQLAAGALAILNGVLGDEGRNMKMAYIVVEADPWPPRGDD